MAKTNTPHTRRNRGDSRRARTLTRVRQQSGGGVLSFTGDVLNDLVAVLVRGVGTVSSLVETGVDTIGTAAREMGDDVLKVHTTQLFRDVGATARKVSNGLGTVVGTVPGIGKSAAYVVEGAGNGVYYLVVKVGDVLGETASRAGRAVKDASNLVVFTLASAHVALDNASDVVQKNVRKATRGK